MYTILIRTINYLSAAVLLLLPAGLSAQSIKYPDEIKTLFDEADRGSTTADRGVPVIAVPQTAEAEPGVAQIRQAGAEAIIVPSTTDGAVLREMAAAWDGALMPDGWVQEGDAFSVLFYKAVADRNIPHTGKSELTQKIDEGMKHYSTTLRTPAELCSGAKIFRRARLLMDGILTIDGHADLPVWYRKGYAVGQRRDNQVSIQKMEEGHLSSQILIAFVGQKRPVADPFAKCDGIIDKIYADIEKNKEHCGFARCEEDAVQLKSEGKKAFFIGVENAYGLGDDVKNVRHFAKRGVVYITLSHLYDNAVCHSSTHSADTTLGLTRFGRKVVKEMMRCGIMVDASHTSSGTFWDCIKYSRAPIICSHSGAKAVFDHDRSLTDDQLRALAAKDGLVMVYVVQQYMGTEDERVGLDHMMVHLQHCIEVAGIDHVGIACDLDGGAGGWGINGDNDMINITVRLLEAGYSDSDIEKIWSKNFFRVLKTVQSAATL